MIDFKAYATEMAALADRFARDVSDDMSQRYYQYLTERMDTSEFQQAARTIYNTDTFWPAPARFLEVIGKDADTRARTAWRGIVTEARRENLYQLDARNLPDEAARVALDDVGGYRHLALHVRDSDMPHLERRFVASYRRWQEAQESAGQLADATKQLTGSRNR